ncbi:MAG: sugar phosphate isomerase/epimerase family protein [Kiritimatiellia bacterium]
MKRREFLGTAVGAALLGGCAAPSCAAEKKGRMLFGACRGVNDTKLMKEVGFDFFESGVAAALKPLAAGDEWKKQRDLILGAALPLRSCNGFLPGSFRLTGPAAKFDDALAYAEAACRHADEVGVKTLVFGSGGARNVPGDFCATDRKARPNILEGVRQFTEFCRQLAGRIAGLNVVVVIEPLSPNESNIVNYVWQGLQIVEEIGSPRLQQLADLFHMMAGREAPASILQAGSRLKHVHVASFEKRLYPGANDTGKLVPYFEALRQIGYAGGVSCECGWGDKKELAKNMATALETMKSLAGQA